MRNQSREDLIAALKMLEESEQRYRNLVENSIQGMSLAQANPLRFIYVSPPMQNICGYSPEEMIRFTPEQIEGLIHPDDRHKFFSRLKEGFQGRLKRARREYRIIHKNGETRWVDLFPSVTMIDGVPTIQGTFVDITDRKLAEIETEESENTYRELLDLAPDAFFLGDKNGNFIVLNRSGARLTGYSMKELSKKNMRDLFTVESLKKSPLRYDLLMKGLTVTSERKLIRKNGKIIDVEMRSLMLPNGTLLSFIRDTTQRKLAEEALQESEQRYKLAFKTSPDSININRMDGTYVDINDGFTRITGYTRRDVIGKSSLELNIWADNSEREKMIRELNRNGRVINLETGFRMKNGSLVTGLMSATIIHLNREPHILSITRDISDRKILEKELLLAKEKAENSDRLKTEFLNNMSHEIRTPLNAVIGFANMLADSTLLPEERQRYAAIVEESGNQLLTIITDIIDISKIDSGQLGLRPDHHDLNNIMDNLLVTFEGTVAAGVELRLEKGKPGKNVLRCDRNRLVQVFSNLLVNAIKFTQEGVVEFGYHLSNREEIEFYVRDTGIGIPASQLTTIFERFRQVNSDKIYSRSGTGLGLSIAKGIVNLWGGEIRVVSEEGKGSAFCFTHPVKPR